MLYKKIHRQYLREFKSGREFRVYSSSFDVVYYMVFEITKEPYIDGIYINVEDNNGQTWNLIHMTSLHYRGIIPFKMVWEDAI